VVRQLVEVIRRERPDVVITFDPSGGYGHPDHLAIHHHTVAAVNAAAVAVYAPDLGDAWTTPRLLYMVFPRQVFGDLIDSMREIGMDTSELEQMSESGIGWVGPIALRQDVGEFVNAKRRALECHRTQFGADNLFARLPDDLRHRLLGVESFALPWPANGEQTLADLFDGIERSHPGNRPDAARLRLD
jgi:LmbE family N-acetylglucosaminyl deacetylase